MLLRSDTYLININWFKRDGELDYSMAFSRCVTYIGQHNLTHTNQARVMYVPTGEYTITMNNVIGLSLSFKTLHIVGDGERASIINFNPSVANGVMYDQRVANTIGLIGFTIEKVNINLIDYTGTNQPVSLVISQATAQQATQRFTIYNSLINATKTSTIISLLGNAVNESEFYFNRLRLLTFKTFIRNENSESVNHTAHWCDFIYAYGHIFDYVRGGCLNVSGGNIIFETTATGENALLCIGEHDGSITGQTSQFYNFNGVRAELRSPTSRMLYMQNAIEGQVNFDCCSMFSSPSNQAFAKVPIQHHANITFRKCVIKKRAAGTSAGLLEFTDNVVNQFEYANDNLARSIITFDGCNHDGDRITNDEPYADYSKLTGASANYRSSVVRYVGCDGIPDSVEYGQATRMGRSYSTVTPPRLIFRGEELPKGDGVNPLYSTNSFNITVPLNNYLTDIHVRRPAMGAVADPYIIEFVDQAEWTTPGTGVIFGETPSQAGNAKINATVAIDKMFTGTRAQRTIWARLKTGVTILSPGKVGDGATIWADVF